MAKSDLQGRNFENVHFVVVVIIRMHHRLLASQNEAMPHRIMSESGCPKKNEAILTE